MTLTGFRSGAAAVILVAAAVVTFTPGTAVADRLEGCGPEYWRTHTSGWEEYTPAFRVSNAWHMKNLPVDERRLTFVQALDDPGPSATVSRRLLRSGVASYLNAAHEGVYYPFRRFTAPYHLQVAINDAIASNDAWRMRTLIRNLDRANGLPCPLQ